MFQLIRRVSGSLLPRPDRPWREDATSHAPTIGRKRRYSFTERDNAYSASTAKKTKNNPVEPDTQCDSASEGESPSHDGAPPAETQEVKAVTKGVEEVDLEDKDQEAEPLSIQPEGIPLPDSPSGSPEPEPRSPEPAKLGPTEETEDVDDKSSAASSAPEDGEEETAPADVNRTPAEEASVTTVESGLCDTPEASEVEA